MKAYVIYEAGGPEQLKLEEKPIPSWKKGWGLIKVKAFGLNRSEYFTRIGDSPTAVSKSKCNNVKFISPVSLEVKSVFRKKQFGWAFPV